MEYQLGEPRSNGHWWHFSLYVTNDEAFIKFAESAILMHGIVLDYQTERGGSYWFMLDVWPPMDVETAWCNLDDTIREYIKQQDSPFGHFINSDAMPDLD